MFLQPVQANAQAVFDLVNAGAAMTLDLATCLEAQCG